MMMTFLQRANDSNIDFSGQVAIVTGAGSGLGSDYALALAARNASVVVNDIDADPRGNIASRRDAKSSAEQVVSAIIASGGKAIACHASCANRDGGEAIVKSAIDAFGRVDIVIHNAGFLRNAPFDELSDEQIGAILDVHLMAGFYVGQPAFRAMKKQGYGRFVLVSSASALFGSPWQANYAAAKAGLVGIMNSIAIEGRQYGILANALLPCGDSRLGREVDDWPSDFYAISPEDYSQVAPYIRNDFVVPMSVWLASNACQVTHRIYTATGGRFARVFIGEGAGWLADLDHPPSPEVIGMHHDVIDSVADYVVPETLWEELESIARARRGDRA